MVNHTELKSSIANDTRGCFVTNRGILSLRVMIEAIWMCYMCYVWSMFEFKVYNGESMRVMAF